VPAVVRAHSLDASTQADVQVVDFVCALPV
jgi:hypothetical protein